MRFYVKIPHMSSQVSKNIFWLTLSRVFALCLLFLAYTRLFRYLGPFASGQYQFILSYVLVFATVVDFGIQQLITKKITQEPENAKKYFQEFFSFEILASGLLYVVLVSMALLWLSYGQRAGFSPMPLNVFYGIIIAGLGVLSNALTYPYLAVLAAFQDLRKVAWVNFLNSCVNGGMIFLAIIFNRHIVFLASIQLVFGILDLIIYWQFVKKHIPAPEILNGLNPFDFKLIKNILREGWPFALLVGFSAIYNRIDVALITLLKGYEQTGFYTAAYKIFDLLGFFPSVVSYTLFPFFAGLMAKNALTEIKENLEKYVRLMFAAALPMAVGGMLLAEKLIALVAGPQYRPAAAVLSVLIWAPAILFIYIPVNAVVLSQLTKKAMVVTAINVLVNILGNLLLIPRFGIIAAAFMTVVSETIQAVFYFYFVKKYVTKFVFIKSFTKPICAAFFMGLVVYMLKNQALYYSLFAGALVYAAVLYILQFFSKAELEFVKKAF